MREAKAPCRYKLLEDIEVADTAADIGLDTGLDIAADTGLDTAVDMQVVVDSIALVPDHNLVDSLGKVLADILGTSLAGTNLEQVLEEE